MQFRLGVVAVFAMLSTSLAAPVNDVARNSLTPRGRVRDKLRQFREGAEELVCSAKNAIHCFNQDVKQYLHLTDSDLGEDFVKWKGDVRSDFELLFADYRVEIADFEKRYRKFKRAVKQVIGPTLIVIVDWATWDIRFHLALMWETLGYLEVDVRGQIYELLMALSLSIHTDLRVDYEKYPKSCTAVLMELEILQKHQNVDVTRYTDQLLGIHANVIAATMRNPHENSGWGPLNPVN